MKITYEDPEMLETPKGGFKRSTLELIGVEMPLQKGWRSKIIGKEIDDELFLAAVHDAEAPLKTNGERKRERKLRQSGQQSLF